MNMLSSTSTLPDDWHSRAVYIAAGTVTIVAAIVSYVHLFELARFSGEGWRAYLQPLSVDGLVVCSSLAAWRAKQRGNPVHIMTKVGLSVGLFASLGANLLSPFLSTFSADTRAALSAAVAAYPAVALALAFEELLRLQSGNIVHAEEQAGTAQEHSSKPLSVRDAITNAIKEQPEASDQDLASRFQCSTRWVRQVRTKFQASSS